MVARELSSQETRPTHGLYTGSLAERLVLSESLNGQRPGKTLESAPQQSFFDGHSWIGYRTYVRLVRESENDRTPLQVKGPHDVHDAFGVLSQYDRERLYSIHLDSQRMVCGVELITQGVLDASLIAPREVFKAAVLANAAGLVLVHNHPSGNPEPSANDHSVTRRLVRGGRILGIPVVDHVIIGHDSYYSFREAGTYP